MLTIFSGGDQEKGRVELKKELDSAKENGKTIISIGPDQDGDIMDLAETQSLFGESFVFVGERDLFTDEFLEEKAEVLVKSPHLFLALIPESIKIATVRFLEKKKVSLKNFQSKNERPAFNVFALADAFLSGDKKELWTCYQKALRTGISSEEIAGIISWQIKTSLLVDKGEAKNLSPYAEAKAKRFSSRHDGEKLLSKLRELTHIYHRAHRGELSFEYSLESFILEPRLLR